MKNLKINNFYGFRKLRHRAIKSGINFSFVSHSVPERDKNVKKYP